MAYSKRNQELYDAAYREVAENNGGAWMPLAYLTDAVLSSRYSASALHAIAAGINRALKDRGLVR